MTTVSILPVLNSDGATLFQAIAGNCRSDGRTPGEALDAVRSQLADRGGSTLIVLQSILADSYFNAEQKARLETLMLQWRSARDRQESLSPELQQELDLLVGLELRAAGLRAQAMADSMLK